MTTTNGYAHPEALVDTQWVADHLKDVTLRLIEVDVDTTAYDSGHIAGAIGWNWRRDTQQLVRRDIPDQAGVGRGGEGQRRGRGFFFGGFPILPFFFQPSEFFLHRATLFVRNSSYH